MSGSPAHVFPDINVSYKADVYTWFRRLPVPQHSNPHCLMTGHVGTPGAMKYDSLVMDHSESYHPEHSIQFADDTMAQK